jgi:hypothetical protein
VTFDIPDVPKKPRNIAMKLLRLKFLDGVHLETVKKVMFWTACVISLSSFVIKYNRVAFQNPITMLQNRWTVKNSRFLTLADLWRTSCVVQECSYVFDKICQCPAKIPTACSCILLCNWSMESHVGSLWIWSTTRSYVSQVPDTGLQASNSWYGMMMENSVLEQKLKI